MTTDKTTIAATTDGTAPEGITRRRLLAYATATPTLAVAAQLADALARPGGPGGPAPAGAQLADIVDFTDALTLAALPTQHLLVIEVTTANRVVVRLPRAEVGQGITTAVAQIAAEELDARLDDVDVVLEDARPELLFNQLTGGSNTIHALYGPLRAAAAGARARLVTAAARRWDVAARDIVTRATAVTGPGGRSATYGELSTAAAAVTAPRRRSGSQGPPRLHGRRPAHHPHRRPRHRDRPGPLHPGPRHPRRPALRGGPPTHPRGDGAHRRRRSGPVDAGRRGRHPHPHRRRRGGPDLRPGASRP